jgi:hypothetical protein
LLDDALGEDPADAEDPEGDEDADPPAKDGKDEPVADADADPIVFKLDDGTAVTRKEAKGGYLRHKDYTQKTQAVAEEKRTLAGHITAYSTLVDQYATFLDSQGKPNLEKIRAEGTAEEYLLAKADWDDRQAERAAVAAEQQRLADLKAAEDAEQQRVRVQEAKAKLLEAVPTWQDKKVRDRETAAIRTYLMDGMGFTDEEVAGVLDPRLVQVLRQAALYDQMAKKARAKVKVGKPTLTPGKQAPATTTQSRRKLSEVRAKLRESGDPDEAGRAFELMGLLD